MGCKKFTQKKCYCDFANKLCVSACANDFFFQKRIYCDLSKLLYVKIMKQNLIFWCQLSIKSLFKNINLAVACRILYIASEWVWHYTFLSNENAWNRFKIQWQMFVSVHFHIILKDVYGICLLPCRKTQSHLR